MADFNLAVSKTLVNEGGYSNNPSDPGKATKYGITQVDMPNVNIADITVAQAESYYLTHFWNPLYNQIISQDVANKLFDLGVLFGEGTAVKILQTILEPYGIEPDGLFGNKTLEVLNAHEPIALLQSYKTAMVSRAVWIGSQHPTERQFVTGWINRINS